MRLPFAAVFALALHMQPAVAQDTPEALLEAIYAPMLSGGFGMTYDQAFSADTRRAMNACVARDEFCIDEGLWTTGNDFELANLRAKRLSLSTSAATYEVSFTNFGSPVRMTYSLVREGGKWKVHDIQVAGRSESLRKIFSRVD